MRGPSAGRSTGAARGFGAGFLAGAILAGAILAGGLATLTCGRSAEKGAGSRANGAAENIVVAQVGRHKITPQDIALKIELQYPRMADMKGLPMIYQQWEILKAMIDQYAWVEAGERHGFEKDKDFKDAMELNRKYILADHTVKRLVYDKSEPTDAQIEAYYKDNIDQFHEVARVEANLILLPSRDVADQVRRRAIAGEDWNLLTHQYTIYEPTRDTGGDIGVVSYNSAVKGFGDKPTALNKSIMALQVGQISPPIQTDQGWALVKVRSRIEERTQPLTEARDAIEKRLTSKRANELFSSILTDVKKTYGANIDSTAWRHYAISALGDDEGMEYCRKEKSPRIRVLDYEDLAAQRPDGAHAAQALFMAGFTCADDLADYARAREIFEKMIAKYPKSELVSSARWMMANMEKGLDNLPYASQLRQKIAGG